MCHIFLLVNINILKSSRSLKILIWKYLQTYTVISNKTNFKVKLSLIQKTSCFSLTIDF